MGGTVRWLVKEKGRAWACETSTSLLAGAQDPDLYGSDPRRSALLSLLDSLPKQPIAPTDYGAAVLDFDARILVSCNGFKPLGIVQPHPGLAGAELPPWDELTPSVKEAWTDPEAGPEALFRSTLWDWWSFARAFSDGLLPGYWDEHGVLRCWPAGTSGSQALNLLKEARLRFQEPFKDRFVVPPHPYISASFRPPGWETDDLDSGSVRSWKKLGKNLARWGWCLSDTDRRGWGDFGVSGKKGLAAFDAEKARLHSAALDKRLPPGSVPSRRMRV